jgi:hypothetical protein
MWFLVLTARSWQFELLLLPSSEIWTVFDTLPNWSLPLLQTERCQEGSIGRFLRRIPVLAYGAFALVILGLADLRLTDNPTTAEFALPIAAALLVLEIPMIRNTTRKRKR